ncbi:MAG: hypothetical protein QT05_C0038G0010 [archaeon GW2011_AR13]|nr:MAG: hypothetical protein QT05_C0038G0010 [archaeon GW2011_AR13]HIG94774.1 DUF3800 domain-containing protein [Nanoarchaeota archaeon]HIH63740.1 DUF3800 domain-containing protein [Nanoarchaeota archaeon]HIJ09613.1 DUF3800 domain-containing protein [Nanoarchaeota archaeon]
MYFVYLDESGDSRFKDNIREEDDFFILGGVLIKEKDLADVNRKFRQFKEKTFPKELWDYPIHAVELNQISKSRRTKYKGIFTDEQGKNILEESYKIMNTFSMEAIVVLIDKYELKSRYPNPKNPYHLAYEILCEKIQKIVQKRGELENSFALINLAECCSNLTTQLNELHCLYKTDGSKYCSWDNILQILNIEKNENSSFYDIADLVCYAFRRHYYSWLCKNLGRMPIKDNYLSLMKNICTLTIGHILFGDKIHIKVFPEPRFLKEIK